MRVKGTTAILCLVAACCAAADPPPALRFDAEGKFKIVQFTDVHWKTEEPEKCRQTLEGICRILDAEKPDLVALTGDIVTVKREPQEAWKQITDLFARRSIPWTAVMGNHDDEEHGVGRRELVKHLAALPGSLVAEGPDSLGGTGNYIVSVAGYVSRKPELALYFLDSNSYPPVPAVANCQELKLKYGWFSFDQVQWYRQSSRELRAANGGKTLPALAFFHIPLIEYGHPLLRKTAVGTYKEEISCGAVNTGAFAAMLEEGDVMGAFAGHDHQNDYVGSLFGVCLAYGRRSGTSSYGELPCGGRVIELREGAREFQTWIRTFDGAVVHRVRFPAEFAPSQAPAGKPASTAARFQFRHRFADRELPGDSWGQTAAADLDRDGRPDFITGRSRGEILWYRLELPNRWVRYKLGDNSPSDVGGAVLDVDGDGWLDFVAGGAWYRNTGKPRAEPFERIAFDKDLSGVHDVVIADLDGDGRKDVLTMSDRNNLRWYKIPKDPRQPWQRHDIGPAVHAGIGVGDIDGDGDLDVVRSNLWFENADGKGTRWTVHENIPFGNPKQPYPLGTRCVALDIDRDGDIDLVMTENEIAGGRIAWIENLDGKGGQWRLHELPQGDPARRGAYHSLIVADFDDDGDPDVFTCEMEGIPGDKPPRWFLWENADGKGQKFVERAILDANLGGHEAVAADFDGDGDLDIVSKLWKPRKDNANGGKNHVDFLENLLKEAKPTR